MKHILITLLLLSSVWGQTDPNVLLDEVKERFEAIEDYSADLNINVDVNFLQMPDSKAKVYYKKPDKFKMDSEGFALLPKQSIGFSPARLLNFDYDAIYVRDEDMDGVETRVLKVLPRSDSTQIVLTTLWIDAEKDVIRKVEANTKNTGAFSMLLSYDEESVLPREIIFGFNISDVNMPMQMPQAMDEKNEMFSKKEVKGTVTITYSNYKINEGIPDEFFEDKK